MHIKFIHIFITGQAMEIGTAAINILIETWEGHLTPPEAASLADKATARQAFSSISLLCSLHWNNALWTSEGFRACA
jgi:hypothetical protein